NKHVKYVDFVKAVDGLSICSNGKSRLINTFGAPEGLVFDADALRHRINKYRNGYEADKKQLLEALGIAEEFEQPEYVKVSFVIPVDKMPALVNDMGGLKQRIFEKRPAVAEIEPYYDGYNQHGPSYAEVYKGFKAK